MTDIKTGLWQNTLDGSFIKVRRLGRIGVYYNDEGCDIEHVMSKKEFSHCYILVNADKPVIDDTFNDDTPAQTTQRKHAHYFKDVSDFNEMDTYLFCRVWKVKDDSGALHHALKKLMDAGKRGNKDKIKDVTEARDTLNRYLEIEAMFAEVSE